ncbi:signal peptidase complex subunit spc2, partial [Elasticomyces elasticus]
NLPKPHGYTQDHTKSTVRFIVGFPAVALAGFTFYADRYLGWEATQSPWIIASVVVYFLLNSVFTVWVWLIEGGEVFSGRRSNGEVVSIRSSSKKHTAQYKLRVGLKSAKGEVLEDKEIESSFTKWFSADGVFQKEPFRQWLAKETRAGRAG